MEDINWNYGLSNFNDKKWLEALHFLEKCLIIDNFDEAKWLNIKAQCYENLGKWLEAEKLYNESLEVNNKYWSSYYHLIKHYREQGNNSQAYSLLMKLPILEFNDYSWEFLYEMSIVGYYCGVTGKKQGFITCHQLLSKDIPEDIQLSCQRNSLFYMQKISQEKNTKKIIIPEVPYINFNNASVKEVWRLCNPSICLWKDKILINCRGVNYKVRNNQFQIFDNQNLIRSKNFLIELKSDLETQYYHEIQEIEYPKFPIFATNMEDLRIISYHEKLYASCVIPDISPSGGKICLAEINQSGKVEKLTVFNQDQPGWEKNWLPFIQGDEIFFIYGYYPFTIIKPLLPYKNIENVYYANTEIVFQKELLDNLGNKLFLKRFRGGSPPIIFEDGLLFTVHEVYTSSHRIYVHHFIKMNHDFTHIQISLPWLFSHQGIEFNAGMCWMSKDRLCLTYGIEDEEAYYCIITKEEINELFIS